MQMKGKTMASKAEERVALEKIREIVGGLGADSYVAITLEGCFDVALDNIDNDFANSPYANYKNAQTRVEKLQAELNTARQNVRTLSALCETLEHDNVAMRNRLNSAGDTDVIRRLEAQAEADAMTIMKLKAKLYDLMNERKD